MQVGRMPDVKMNPFSEFLIKLKDMLASFSPAKKVSLIAAALIVLTGIALLVYWSGRVDYSVLFSNLSNEDAGGIIAKLQEKKVPYRLSADGGTVSVPAQKVAELRLDMATSGLPQGGGVGFEIFDKKSFGSSEFEQQINYRRALQGELARTINSLEEIQQSRVHLALPKDSLFVEQQKKATASVTVKLKPGKTLRPLQVEGIAHLVASSIEGMNAEDVTVVDSRGNILSTMPSGSKLTKMTAAQIDHQRNTEKELASRIQSLLENVVGKGKAAVRVSAEMDFKVTEQTEEKYDPESPVARSVKRVTDKTTLPPNVQEVSDAMEHEKSDETINYEINRLVSKTVLPVGTIRKISVAVLIDGVYAKNEKGEEAYQPRSKKDIDALVGLVQKSAGINSARGDQVVLTEMPFSKPDLSEMVPESGWREKLMVLYPLIKYFLALIAVLAIIMYFVRPLLKELMIRDLSRSVEAARGVASAGGVEDTVQISDVLETQKKGLTDREIAKKLAGEDTKKFAEILKMWLK
jgi:flagellar M-ring protein FliF